jgi:hypothetical protein
MIDKTPYEILRGEPPDVSHLVHFYAPGVYHLTKEERKDTWDFKAHKCRMLGYDERCKNTYVIVTIPEGRIISRKDCLFDESLRGYNIPLLMDQDVKTETRLINFESEDHEEPDDKFIGDNVAPYFALSRDEYREQQDRDAVNACFETKCFWNDVCLTAQQLTVHQPLALPPDPKSVEEALAGPERPEWIEAIIAELENFDSRAIIMSASQTSKAMKTKMVLKYAYTIKRNAMFVVCGYSQIPGRPMRPRPRTSSPR